MFHFQKFYFKSIIHKQRDKRQNSVRNPHNKTVQNQRCCNKNHQIPYWKKEKPDDTLNGTFEHFVFYFVSHKSSKIAGNAVVYHSENKKWRKENHEQRLER